MAERLRIAIFAPFRMSASQIILALIIPIGIICLLVFIAGKFMKWVFEPKVGTVVPDNQVEMMLFNKLPYYRKLDPPLQQKFRQRLSEYMVSKEFVGRKDLVVTDEMRVLISAAAIQVTLGLDDFMMDNFSRIFVYPGPYKSKVTGQYHQGDVNLGGVIAFSWPNFVEGYQIGDNNRNLGLHEMAHAVRFSKFKGDYDQFFSDYFDKWSRIARDEFDNVRDGGDPSLFRDYAGSNINEFFAVCTEHFFETPHVLKKELPELYHHTCILLNQDPSKGMDFVGVRNELLEAAPAPALQRQLITTPYTAFPGFLFGIILLSSTLNYIAARDIAAASIFFWPSMTACALIANQFMKRMIIYDDGIVVRHPITTPHSPRRIIPFSNVLSAELREVETSGKYGPRIVQMIYLTYLYKGKAFSHEAAGSLQELRSTGEYLHRHKVAVKVFDEKLKWD